MSTYDEKIKGLLHYLETVVVDKGMRAQAMALLTIASELHRIADVLEKSGALNWEAGEDED